MGDTTIPAGFYHPDAIGQHQNVQPAFTFPVIRGKEIIILMEEMGVKMEKIELTEPSKHRDRLKQIWFQLLHHCTGKCEEDIKDPYRLDEDASEETKILYADSGDAPLFRALRLFLSRIGYDQFSMRDIYAPDPKRLKDQLSAVINFAKFREEHLPFYQELCENRPELIDALEEVHEQNKELIQKREESRASQVVKSVELQEIIDECNELELEIRKDSRLQGQLRDEAAALKRQVQDLKAEITTSELTLQELELQEEDLRTKVVSSPARRKAEAEELRARVQSEKKENIAVDNNIQKCKTIISELEKAGRDLRTTSAMLIQLHRSTEKCVDTMRSLDEIIIKIANVEKECRGVEEEAEQAQRRGHRHKEEILAQRKQQGLQLEAVQEALDSFKSQLLIVEKERREAMLRVQQGEAEVDLLKEAMEVERTKTENEIQEMVAQYKTIERAFLERDQRRLELLGINVHPTQPLSSACFGLYDVPC